MELRFEVGMERYEARVLETNRGQGGAAIGVLVQCCTECNTLLYIGGLLF